MTSIGPIPILALPLSTVLFPNRKLQISASNRPDIFAIIAEYYDRSLSGNGTTKTAVIGCVPLRSPYLGSDGEQLIESGDAVDVFSKQGDAVTKDNLFNFGVLATISSVEGGRSGDLKIVVEGGRRIKLQEITQVSPYFAAKVTAYTDEGKKPHPMTSQHRANAHHSRPHRSGP
jgi:hypothetical protein